MHILLISNSRTEQAMACADALTAAFGAQASWLPDERRLIEQALSQLAAEADCRTILLCGGDALGPSAHQAAALTATRQGSLPGFGEALRRQLEASLGTRAMLIQAPAGHINRTAVFTIPLSVDAVLAAAALITPCLDIYHRHLRGEVLPEMPAAAAPEPEPEPDPSPGSQAAAAPAPQQTLNEGSGDIPAGISIAAMPSESSAPEREQLASGWRAGLRAIGGRLDREIWAEIPEELSRIAPARNLLERAGQRAAVLLSSGRVMGAFGFPDLQREGSKVLLVGDGAPIAEVIALHRHPQLAGLTIWGSSGLLPSADSDVDRLAEARLGRPPPTDGELFAIDHDAIYLQRGSDVTRWDGQSQERQGTESQAIASLLLRWSQR